jgi:hypothetical protein
MKKIMKYVLAVIVSAFIFVSCEDRSDIIAPPAPGPINGAVDLTRFVTIGNSITAGYQAGSLFESSQRYAYGNLIADIMNTTFQMPLISDPGTAGRLEVVSLSPFITRVNPASGSLLNVSYPKPYNNLGVYGAFLYDILNATNAQNSASGLAGRPNPFFDLVLRNSALNIGSQFAQAKIQQPTFVITWIGNNDVLGYATSGGVSPSRPTNIDSFTVLFNKLADSLASLGAKVAVANIPDVTSIPFFNTVGPMMAFQIPWRTPDLPGLFYQKHGASGTGVADSIALLTGKHLVTLTGSGYASLLGTPTGKFYRDYNFPGLPPGIDTAKPFGFHPTNPWPDALILDEDEIAVAQTAVESYNSTIATAANLKGFALANINLTMKQLRASDFSGGTVINGVTFRSTFLTGGVFGLDGVHPTNQGQGIIANEFIKAINTKFGSNIPLVNVSTIPASIYLAKYMNWEKQGYPDFIDWKYYNILF